MGLIGRVIRDCMKVTEVGRGLHAALHAKVS